MHNLTKLCLKKPVSTVIIIIALIIFSINAITGMNMQLTPDMEFPMVIAFATYPQAGPEEVDRLVAQELENMGATVQGLDTIMTRSYENYCYAVFSFDYGTDMDDAYMDLQEELARLDLPDDVDTPKLIIMDINAAASINVSVTSKSGNDVLNFVNDTLEPEISKISNVASTDVTGGQEEYISVHLMPEKLEQYGINMASVASFITSSKFTMPAGNVDIGNQRFAASAEMEFSDINDIRNVPITTSTGQLIHLSDIAVVSYSAKEASSISRYNGSDNVQLSITKEQGSNAVKLSRDVKKSINKLSEQYKDYNIDVIYDSADTIVSSIRTVAETLVLGVILSMLVLFIFFGDLKASLIVGSSMPISLLVTIILMGLCGYSINVITMGALVIAIGMMVDNSIVVLEMCFQKKDQGFSFQEAAYDAVKTVALSVTASTITTVVVYLPLAMMKGLSGQLFGQLGFTIIFALIASLISSITIVPLCFAKYRPIEKKDFVVNKVVKNIAEKYGDILSKVLRHKKKAALVGILLFIISIAGFKLCHVELMSSTDYGIVGMNVDIRPGLSLAKRDELLKDLESFVSQDPDVESYSVGTQSNTSTLTVSAYLKKDRKRKTKEIISDWNTQLADKKDCNIVCSNSQASSMGRGSSRSSMSSDSKEVDLRASDLQNLKAATNEVAEALRGVKGVTNITTSFSNASSKAKVVIDPLKSTAAGIMPATAAQNLYLIKNGKDALDVSFDDSDYTVTVEYPAEMYDSVEELMNVTLTSQTGKKVFVSDIADIVYTDTPQMITRQDGYYNAAITCTLDEDLKYDAQKEIDAVMEDYNLPRGITIAESSYQEMMREEFTSIIKAMLIALWLVFMVMTMQFESARFAAMIMVCIPFSLIGSVILLIISQATVSMNSMMGFLMLEGIVVNNGILMVDTTNQELESNPVEVALVVAGKSRLRPILMTTLTTILSMVPLTLGIGNNAETMQGMAVVIVGGLIASTLLALLLLPVFYMIIRKKSKSEKDKKKGKFGFLKGKKMPEVDTENYFKDEGTEN